MKPVSAADLAVLLSIAAHLSFSRAAVELGLSPSALSHALRALEERLGVRLFNRTTRSVAMTEAGERLYARIKPVFRDIDGVLDDLNQFRNSPSGTLRINAGRAAAQLVLLPLVERFLEAYPDVAIEITANDALVDVVSPVSMPAYAFASGWRPTWCPCPSAPTCARWWWARRPSSTATPSSNSRKTSMACLAFATAFPAATSTAGSSSAMASSWK